MAGQYARSIASRLMSDPQVQQMAPFRWQIRTRDRSMVPQPRIRRMQRTTVRGDAPF
jgi:hypothetical protein